MKALLKIAKIIAERLLAGLNELRVGATPAVLKYLDLLEELATQGVERPLAVAAVGFLGYGITATSVDILQYLEWGKEKGTFGFVVALLLTKTEVLWSSLIALAGVMSFGYFWLCGVLVAPVGIVAHATVPNVRSVPTTPVTVSWGTLAGSILTQIRDARVGVSNALHAGVEKYVHQVRFVLTFIGGTYLVTALFPNLRVVTVQLVLGALVLTAMKEFRNPVATFLKFVFCGALLWFIAAQTFPALNPFKSAFGVSPEEFTGANVKTTVQSLWDSTNSFIMESWTKPAFWLLLIALLPFAWVTYRALLGLGKKVSGQTAEAVSHTTTAPASHTHAEGEHHSSSRGSSPYGWLKVIAVVVVIVGIGWLIANSMMGSWNLALERQQNAEVRRHTIAVNEATRRENAARASATVPSTPRNGSARVTLEPSPTPVMASPSLIATSKLGLQNAKGYVLALSTNRLSLAVPCPSRGYGLMVEPVEYLDKVELFINGMKWDDRIPGAQNKAPTDGKFVQYIAKDTTVTKITAWYGRRVTTQR